MSFLLSSSNMNSRFHGTNHNMCDLNRRHAQLPINISDNLARSIEQRFKGTVSRAVFDDAIIEVYRLLEGPFRRFVHSEAFKEYAKTKADFSMSVILNPKAIVPHDGKEDPEIANRFVIEEYVHTL